MNTRISSIAASLLAAACTSDAAEMRQAPAASSATSARTGKSAAFDARHELKITVPDGAQSVRAWFTMPQEVPEQRVSNLEIESALPHRIVTDDHGNRAIYVEMTSPSAKELVVLETFRLTRLEELGDVDPAHARPLTPTELVAHQGDLAENQHVKITPEMRAIAASVVGAEKNPVVAARKLYDWTLDNIEYWVKDVKNKKASPVGSSEYCLSTKTGNCTDFHSLWAALARAVGIPTRIIYGSIFKPELDGQDKDASYHFPEGETAHRRSGCRGA